jgi:hypothetical protein
MLAFACDAGILFPSSGATPDEDNSYQPGDGEALPEKTSWLAFTSSIRILCGPGGIPSLTATDTKV